MFKAKLIEGERYYRLKRTEQILSILSIIPIGMVAYFFSPPDWLSILLLVAYALGIIWAFGLFYQLRSMKGNRLIEIDNEEIRIKYKNGKGKEVISLGKVDEVIVKKDYEMSAPPTIYNHSKINNPVQNFIIVKQNGISRKFDFEMPSFYSINQMNKIIQGWINSGLQVKHVK